MTSIDNSGNIHGTDGRFAGHVKGSNQGLSLSQPLTEGESRMRAERIAKGGYVPFLAVVDGQQVRARQSPSQAWAEMYALAEHNRDGKDYPLMPDGWTPASGPGRSVTGNRHTARRTTTYPDMDLTIPSAAAIKDYAETTNGTFGIPYWASHATNGMQVKGWALVTHTPNGRWEVTTPSFDGVGGGLVAARIQAQLEGTRTRYLPAKAAEVISRAARERADAVPRDQLAPVTQSSFITGQARLVDEGVSVLRLGERIYGYRISEDVHDELLESDSMGSYFGKNIKGCERVEVEECPSCHAIRLAGSPHACRSATTTPQPTGFDEMYSVLFRREAVNHLRHAE